MKKRSCRRSETERSIHDQAVKIRKMTDEQIADHINSLRAAQRTRAASPKEAVANYIDSLEKLIGTGNGIGPGTIFRLRQHLDAWEMGA